jgi:hypothetical protein
MAFYLDADGGVEVAEKKQRGHGTEQTAEPAAPSGAGPAVPPPDDPLKRYEGGQQDIDSAEAAALRVEAIRRTRQMPADDEPPPGKQQR